VRRPVFQHRRCRLSAAGRIRGTRAAPGTPFFQRAQVHDRAREGPVSPRRDIFIPDNWVVNQPIRRAIFDQLSLTDDGLLQADGYEATALFDPVTLELLD